MSSKPGKAVSLRGWSPAVWMAAAVLAARFSSSAAAREAYQFLDKVVLRVFGGFPGVQSFLWDALEVFNRGSGMVLGLYIGLGLFALPLGFLVRILARGRVRAGTPDPLASWRAWAAAHPAKMWLFSSIPAVLWAAGAFRHFLSWNQFSTQSVATVELVLAYALAAGMHAWGRAFLAPTVDPEESLAIEIQPDEITFDAVAVTRETRGAVAGLAGLSLVMVVWLAALPIATLFRDPRLFAAVAVYTAIAFGGAALFRLASRVAVGVDGVLVKGTSRTRFFPYRDLDDARVTWEDVELVRKDRAVLRLQLHGTDAARREAVLARIRQNIARVKQGKDAMAAQLVASATAEQLTRVASGGADYRAASLSRDALWGLIEGPTVDGGSRTAAAAALA
ncbi:MAG TPA: hypothetical protein VGI39_32325, partial [Polyangiaceae bacterium]